jgi:hypothetical protein
MAASFLSTLRPLARQGVLLNLCETKIEVRMLRYGKNTIENEGITRIKNKKLKLGKLGGLKIRFGFLLPFTSCLLLCNFVFLLRLFKD